MTQTEKNLVSRLQTEISALKESRDLLDTLIRERYEMIQTILDDVLKIA